MQINSYPGRQVMKNGKQETIVVIFLHILANTQFIKENKTPKMMFVKFKA